MANITVKHDAYNLKVRFDAYNRTFKLVDGTFASLLEDDGVYDLVVPFPTEEDSFLSIESIMAQS